MLEPLRAGLVPAEAFGLVHLGLGGTAGSGAIPLLQAAQPVVLLDLAAGVADAQAAVVEFGAAAVFTDGGGEYVDVVVGVAYGDPAAGQVVTGRCDAGRLDNALGDLAPLGVGEVAVLGCGADGAVPDVVGDLLSELAVAQPHGLVEVAGEFGEGGVLHAAGVRHAEHREPRHDVRIEVLVVAARAVEVGEQAAGVGPGPFDGSDHADASGPGSAGRRKASAISSSRSWSSVRRWRMSGGVWSLLRARAI